jgi:hypothetical protein
MTTIYYNCGIEIPEEFAMPTASIRIDAELVEQARSAAKAEFRTVQGQLEYWAKIGRTALANPDLPVDFIAESLIGLAEPRESAKPFILED